jgi:23S rRNA maturation mini-RNase III
MEAKPRPIKLEAHVLAYLGDFMNIFEESIRRQILKEINNPTPSASHLNSADKPPSAR